MSEVNSKNAERHIKNNKTMRAIEFRGQCLGSKKWVYGSIITSDNGAQIHVAHNELYAVDPETVGQFTGRIGKDGKEIYEGDRIKTIFSYTEWRGYVAFLDGNFVLMDSDKNGQYLTLSALSGVEIIGNIHDNPELLKNE